MIHISHQFSIWAQNPQGLQNSPATKILGVLCINVNCWVPLIYLFIIVGTFPWFNLIQTAVMGWSIQYAVAFLTGLSRDFVFHNFFIVSKLYSSFFPLNIPANSSWLFFGFDPFFVWRKHILHLCSARLEIHRLLHFSSSQTCP